MTTAEDVTAALEFQNCMEAEWLELSRYRDLLRHTLDNHNGASQASADRLLTVAEAVARRLDEFMGFLADEFS